MKPIKQQLLTGVLVLLSSLVMAQKKPNVLFILSDDHSTPFLGCYGNPDLKTPHMDRLAKEGVRFNQAFTAAPQCVLSRASLLTGRNVLAVDMLRFSSALPKEYVTFPELMKKDGYYAGICGRSYHLDGSGSHEPKETIDVMHELGLITFPDRVDYIKDGVDSVVATLVSKFLDQVPSNKPFVMWANYSNPHRPFTAKAFEPDPSRITIPDALPDTKLLRRDLAGFYGEIQQLDQYIGDLWAVLEKRGLMDNTIIVFMGDNGAALLRGKGTLYRCGLQVPLLVRYPGGVKKGITSDVLVSGIDIAPTILELVGTKPNAEMEGKSLAAALRGTDTDVNEYIFAVRGPHASSLPRNSAAFDLSRTVFSKNYKLIYNPIWQIPFQPVDFNNSPLWKDLNQRAKDGTLAPRFRETAIFTPTRPMFEFFDLRKDPDEFVNLADNPAYKEAEYALKVALQRWMIVNRDVIPLPIVR